MRLIAFDPGLKNTGVAIMVDDSIVDTFTLRPNNYFDLMNRVYVLLREVDPHHVVVEGIIHNSRNPESHLQAHAIICTALQTLKIPYTELVPSTWKKETVGKGNAKKQEVAAWVKKLYGKINQHECDALCMALAWKVIDDREKEEQKENEEQKE